MIEQRSSSSIDGDFRQIEDIIDSRKLLGQYDVRPPNLMLYTYSSFTSVRAPTTSLFNEGDSSLVKHTDSEITVVKVRRSECSIGGHEWDDMRDVAVPGDGTHLGESPSMVNLVTLVGDTRRQATDEYLVPLSSWEPRDQGGAESKGCRSAPELNDPTKSGEDDTRTNWTGRIRRFICKHCKKCDHENCGD